MDYLKEYDNGLRLLVLSGGFYSVTFGINVECGLINESNETNGLSHFLEHMSFKGTKDLTSKEISNRLELLGSSYNAFTSTDRTFFHAKAIKENLEETFNIISSLVVKSTYPEEEFNRERNVVLEEINMSLDDPEDVCFAQANKAYFGDDGYGRTILGPSANIKKFSREDLVSYANKQYVASNMIVAFVGNITLEEAEKLVDKYIMPYVKVGSKIEIPKHNTKCLCNHLALNKDVEQTKICIDFEDISYNDDLRKISNVTNFILGGGMSSRLFTRIREELSLAYTIYSSRASYKDCGYIELYAGVSNDKAIDAINEMFNVVKEFAASGCTQEELQKAITTIKVDNVFGLEKPESKLSLNIRYLYRYNELYDYEKDLKDYEKITKKDIDDYINKILKSNFSTSLVGKNAKEIKFDWRV